MRSCPTLVSWRSDADDLNAFRLIADTDKLICIKGLVIRATPIIPDMKTGAFTPKARLSSPERK